VTDGAWGTELQKLGLPAGMPPELWNVDNPEAVRKVATGYVDAGSDVILSNTFAANRYTLAGHGAANRAAELAEAGAAISRAAAGDGVKVFASVGSSGKIVMMGDVDEAELAAAFAEAAKGVTAGGADAIILETFNELAELTIAVRAIKAACDLPVLASMTFASGPQGAATMMGDSPADLAAGAEVAGADAIGANCGMGPENYVKVAGLLRSATALPVWIKANAGMPVVADGTTTFPMGPDEFAGFVAPLVDAGANFIGGCCGTTPEHIRAIRQAVDGLAG
jgi:methionine synthase I (cobalamin-dependent)